MSLPRRALLLALPLLLAALPLRPSPAQASEALRITADIIYDLRLDGGPVRVSWDVRITNNDPETVEAPSGVISFYDSMPVPLLQGADQVSARSQDGAELAVTLDGPVEEPIVTATVFFDRRLFYQDTYAFTLEYTLPASREESLIVTPYYVFLPAIALGDQANVSILTPNGSAWEVSLEPVDCEPAGTFLSCQGGDSIYLAALVEVAQPGATASIPAEVSLREKDILLTITYFQGEEEWARHLRDLAAAALPVIEELYGFPYRGPFAVNIVEGGRQVVLGYEGLTSCGPNACESAVSPIADDLTVLHELAHRWSDVYGRRWLAEGFAELIALRAAERLGPELVRGEPPPRDPFALELPLDEWGEVAPLIAADDQQRLREDAGYARSLHFLLLLEDALGLQALQRANAALAEGGPPADSRRFLDALEEASGRNLDTLFLEWVFPPSFAPTLEDRREARERLAALREQAGALGLDPSPLEAIQADVAAWRFDRALAALEGAEGALNAYLQIADRLSALRAGVAAAGLEFPATIDEALARWEFEALAPALEQAEAALMAYREAKAKVEAPRSLWQRIGLWGSDPEGELAAAARAFARGDFPEAMARAQAAREAVEGATSEALLRLLVPLGAFAAVAAAALGGVVYQHRRQRYR